MTFSEYMQLSERAKAAGIGDDKSLAQLLHYFQFQEVATRNFQAYELENEFFVVYDSYEEIDDHADCFVERIRKAVGE